MDSDQSALAHLVDNPRNTRSQAVVELMVVHITGRATWKNAARNKQHPLARLERILFNNPSNESTSTYSLDPWGELWQHQLESQQPWAQGFDRNAVKRKPTPRWWHEYWGEFDANIGVVDDDERAPELLHLDGPLELIGSRRNANYNAVSVECVQWGNQFLLTTAQYQVLSLLIGDVCERHNLPKDPLHVCGHEDVAPWYRGDSDGGWDPGARRAEPRFDWEAVLSLPDQEPQHQLQALFELVDAGLAIRTPERPAWLPEPKTALPCL